MACDEDRGWAETTIAGLHVRGDRVTGMRLLGWEGVLPLSVVRTVVSADREGLSTSPGAMAFPRSAPDGYPLAPVLRRHS